MSQSNDFRGSLKKDIQKIPALNRSLTSVPCNTADFVQFTFDARKIFKYLITIIFCLVTLNLIGQTYKYIFNGGMGNGLIRLFSLRGEACIPSIYSSFALLLCSVLLAIIAKSKYQAKNCYRLHWKFLALIFLYLAIDEAAIIHELSGGITRDTLNTSGFLHHAWVIPGMILFSLFALIYLKFVLLLPAKTRFLFILSAAIFISGAIGLEAIGGQVLTLRGEHNLIYNLVVTVEETLEMVAIAIFIYTLLDYIKKYIKPVVLRF